MRCSRRRGASHPTLVSPPPRISTIRRCMSARPTIRKGSGRRRHGALTGSRLGGKCWSGTPPWAKWFVGGQLNASYNCVDRHALGQRAGKRAIIWEGEPGDTRVLTYADLYTEVNRFAQRAARIWAFRKVTVVAFYMPMIPEAGDRACWPAPVSARPYRGFRRIQRRVAARPHQRLPRRSSASPPMAAGGAGNIVPLKDTADAAVAECPTIEHVWSSSGRRQRPRGRDAGGTRRLVARGAERASQEPVPPEPLDSEHPLYILYTSGTTGKPKGQLHTTGGYLTGTSLTQRGSSTSRRTTSTGARPTSAG